MFHILNCGYEIKWAMIIAVMNAILSDSLKSWLFQASSRNCLNCIHHCDDHSSLDKFYRKYLLIIISSNIFILFFENHRQVKTSDIISQRFGDFMTPISRLQMRIKIKNARSRTSGDYIACFYLSICINKLLLIRIFENRWWLTWRNFDQCKGHCCLIFIFEMASVADFFIKSYCTYKNH